MIKKYWPWLLPLSFMVVYEIISASTNIAPTLSEIVWAAPSYLAWIVIPILVILVAHFWFGLWGPKR